MLILKNDIAIKYAERELSRDYYLDIKENCIGSNNALDELKFKKINFLYLIVEADTKKILTWSSDNGYSISFLNCSELPLEAPLIDYELLGAKSIIEFVFTCNCASNIQLIVQNTLPVSIGAINIDSKPYVVNYICANAKLENLLKQNNMRFGFEKVLDIDPEKLTFLFDKTLYGVTKDVYIK